MFIEFFDGKKNGIFSDTTIDMFINGFTPKDYHTNHNRELKRKDNRGGFFKNVFESNVLTNRHYVYSKEDFKRIIVENLEAGNSLSLVHTAVKNKYNHIINLWGVEFDDEGNVTGVYITDSDDQYAVFADGSQRGLVRYKVYEDGLTLKVSTPDKEKYGHEIVSLYSLSLGTKYWEKYFTDTTNRKELLQKQREKFKKDEVDRIEREKQEAKDREEAERIEKERDDKERKERR